MVLPFLYDFLLLSRTWPVGHTALMLMPHGYTCMSTLGIRFGRWCGSWEGVMGRMVKVVGSVQVLVIAVW